MNESEMSDLIVLLKKDENATMRTELAELIMSAIEDDFALRDKIVKIVNRDSGRRINTSG